MIGDGNEGLCIYACILISCFVLGIHGPGAGV